MEKENIYRETVEFDNTEFHLQYSTDSKELTVSDATYNEKLNLALSGAKHLVKELNKFIKEIEKDNN